MRSERVRSRLIRLATLAAFAMTAATTQAAPVIEAPGRITTVVVHDGWASVTRELTLELSRGLHAVHVVDLPDAVEPASLRAAVSEAATVTRIEFLITENFERHQAALTALDERRAELKNEIAEQETQLQVFDKEESLLDAIAERTARQSGEQAGSGRVDLDELTRLSRYLAEQHADLAQRRRAVKAHLESLQAQLLDLDVQRDEIDGRGPPLQRTAAVGLSVNRSDLPVELRLTYLVSSVRTRIGYTIRTDSEQGRSTIEYDLEIGQESGEDWNEVQLTYSTAPVVDPVNPPGLEPRFLEQARDVRLDVRGPEETGPLVFDRTGISRLVGPAAAWSTSRGEPPFTSYRIATPTTIESRGGELQRLRLVTIAARPVFRYVIAPLISTDAWLRGTIENAGRVHLLPGPVAVFLDGQFVGRTALPYVAPGDTVDVYFGTDPRVTVERVLHHHRLRHTGLLGDGRETTLQYRLRLASETGRRISVECWERLPLSRDDRISISSADISPALSRDADYRTRLRRQGYLRWDLDLGPEHRQGRERAIEYTVVISHKSDVEPPQPPR